MNYFSSEFLKMFLYFLFIAFATDLVMKNFDKTNLKTAFYFRSIIAKIVGALSGTIVFFLMENFL